MKQQIKKIISTLLILPTLALAQTTIEDTPLPPELYGRVVVTQNSALVYSSDFTLEEGKVVNLFSKTTDLVKNARKAKADNTEILKNINTGFSILRDKNMFSVSYSYFTDVKIIEKENQKLLLPNTYGIKSIKHIKTFQCHTDELLGEAPNSRLIGLKKDVIVVSYALCQNKENLPTEKSLLDNPNSGAKNTQNSTMMNEQPIKITPRDN